MSDEWIVVSFGNNILDASNPTTGRARAFGLIMGKGDDNLG